MPNYDFALDHPIAERTEQQVAKFIEEVFPDAEFLEFCDNADYDLKFRWKRNGKEFTIEVKEDFTCAETGNIGVEVSSWGRRSGIAISKADFYLYKVHRPDGKIGVYAIETAKLKQMIKDKVWHRQVVGGDVGSNSKNYLFDLETVKREFMYFGLLEW